MQSAIIESAVLQKTTNGATPLMEALGISRYRIIPMEGNPTSPVLTVEEFDTAVSNLIARGRITTSDADRLSSQAREVMPADFGAVIEAAMAVELPLEFGTDTLASFVACNCGLDRFIQHGVFTVTQDGDPIMTSDKIFTLRDGFILIGSFSRSYPEYMSGYQALALFQSMVQAGLDINEQQQQHRINSFDEETRAAYDAIDDDSNIAQKVGKLMLILGTGFVAKPAEVVTPQPLPKPTFWERILGRANRGVSR